MVFSQQFNPADSALEFHSDFGLTEIRTLIDNNPFRKFVLLVFGCADPRLFELWVVFLNNLKTTFPDIAIAPLINPGGAKVLKDEKFEHSPERKAKIAEIDVLLEEGYTDVVVLDVLHQDCKAYKHKRVLPDGSILSVEQLDEVVMEESDNFALTILELLGNRFAGMMKFMMTLDKELETANGIEKRGGFLLKNRIEQKVCGVSL